MLASPKSVFTLPGQDTLKRPYGVCHMKLIEGEIQRRENQTNGYPELTDDDHFSSGNFLSKYSNNEKVGR